MPLQGFDDRFRDADARAPVLVLDAAGGTDRTVLEALGAGCRKLAVMDATASVTDAMPETLHAAELQRRNEAGEFPECQIQGPLSFDLAYAPDAADKKRVGGPVVGAADVMLFPNLAAA